MIENVGAVPPKQTELEATGCVISLGAHDRIATKIAPQREDVEIESEPSPVAPIVNLGAHAAPTEVLFPD